MFADDCVLYKITNNLDDCTALQHDLNRVFDWCQTWEMKINPQKCVHMCFTRKETPHVYSDNINGTSLNRTFEHKYLGVYLTSDLSWRRHVNYVCAKACSVLGFLRRSAKQFPVKTNKLLLETNVHPILECACTVWDPGIKSDIEKLEKLQN